MSLKKFIDIGANLLDSMYQGIYNGKSKHEPDFSDLLTRSWNNGLDKIILTGVSLKESKEALDFTNTDSRLYCTVGCHPTNCNDFEKSGDADQYLKDLSQLISNGREKVVALGEFGLDYDRLNFCSKETQLTYFEKQLIMNKEHNMPLFLHCRNASEDMYSILSKYQNCYPGGVVHSFDGSYLYAQKFIDLGLYIGINGCSLKTDENLNVVKQIPSNKLMIETDCPWCEIKQSHASSKYVKTSFPSVKKEKWTKGSMIKGRNEPSNIIQVLEVIAGIKGEDIDILCEQIYNNTQKLFFQNR
ncbi:deoxyribonuclease TATDN1 isoform X1 [Halyomorpha halys]|uniref:deoxyribonuclease TATDN1 isoform X1 n=1 Tax=Halyomorpha halys TaxID=286706 RepID=UPI0006D50A80|nr:putative deoxyribonuclease TATDN1 [Halyomorpha halys]